METVSEEIEVDQNKNDEVFGDNKQFSGVIINRTLEASEFDKHNLKYFKIFFNITSNFIKITKIQY